MVSSEGRYTSAFDPHYRLVVSVKGGETAQKHWLHFDAEYRLETAEVSKLLHDSREKMLADADDDELGYEQEVSRLNRREDLFKIYTYRDGTLSTRGAYILFPGDSAGMRMEGATQNLLHTPPLSFRQHLRTRYPASALSIYVPGETKVSFRRLKHFSPRFWNRLAWPRTAKHTDSCHRRCNTRPFPTPKFMRAGNALDF